MLDQFPSLKEALGKLPKIVQILILLTLIILPFVIPIIRDKILVDVCPVVVYEERQRGKLTYKSTILCWATKESDIASIAESRAPRLPPVVTKPSPEPKPVAEAKPEVSPSPPSPLAVASPTVAALVPTPSPSLLDTICPRRAVPASVSDKVPLDGQICAVAACAGNVADTDQSLMLLIEWRRLIKELEKQPCRTPDKRAVSNVGTIDRIHDAVDKIPIPISLKHREICRAVKNTATEQIEAARREMVLSIEREASCPETQRSVHLEEFVRRYNLP